MMNKHFMSVLNTAILPICLFFTFSANAGTPVNGTTQFNSVAAGVKASGNAAAAGGITASDIEGFNFRLNTATSGPTMIIEVWDGTVGTGNGVAFYESTSAINPLFSGITITANDGSKFDLTSIGINAQSLTGGSTTVTVTGLNASGNPVAGATTTGLASVSALTVFNVNANAAFKGIYGIRITSTDIVYAFIDNIAIANVNVLPVKWLDFSALDQNKNIVLKWGTAFEQGTTNFIVQHSRNGTDWNDVGAIAAAGNSSTDKLYSFIHVSPVSGGNYYRLIQLDMDGKQSISKVVYIHLKNRLAMTVYPTLVTNDLLKIKADKKMSIRVFNSVGTLVLVKALQPGENRLTLERLPAGVYMVRANEETASFIIANR